MSAPQIPNLLTSRGGPRSRGRGRGASRLGGGAEAGGPSAQRKDLAIQSTDTDAAVSRLSAVSLGYLEDPFASCFVAGEGTRRMPIINRGTYTRTTALDILINAFISQADSGAKPQKKQIVSLGAGTDTRYFRLRSKNKHQNLIYHEFDFPSVSTTKSKTVSNNRLISKSENEEFFPESRPSPFGLPQDTDWGVTMTKGGIPEVTYCCHPMDLRQIPNLKDAQDIRGVQTDIPTLIISECCLCYLEMDTARDVVKWFADRIPSAGIVLYEPIGVDDAFGQVMVSNLASRNIAMPTLEHYTTLSNQKARLLELGFEGEGNSGGQEAETIENIWQKWVSDSERERVDRLEGLDEVEEWQMLARHYAVVWGWRGTGWEGWSGLRDADPSR